MEKVWYRRSLALMGVIAIIACSGFMYQIAATGDVTGNLPGPLTVAKLQGRTLDSAAPSSGNTITWDGSRWLPAMLPWTSLTGTAPNISTFPNNSGYLTSVAWSAVTSKPTVVSYFTNDSGYLRYPDTITAATTAAAWTGEDQVSIFVGGSTATSLVAKTVDAAYLNISGNKTMAQVNCATDTGSLSLKVTRTLSGSTAEVADIATCSNAGGTTSSLSITNLANTSRLGYIISSPSGSPTSLAIAIKFTR